MSRQTHLTQAYFTIRVLAIVIVISLICGAATPDKIDPLALLKQSDRFRNGWSSYVLQVKITAFESDKSTEEKLYEVSQKGTDKTYVEFLSPREKGRHLLMLGDDMWIYLPDTSHPVRITPLERLAGEASNGDVARTNYAIDYTPVYLGKERIGGEDCYVLDLTAKRKASTYQKIQYWLRVEDSRPVKADFFLTSGKRIKTATFDEYIQVGGRDLLAHMTFYDQIRHNSHTVLEYSHFAPRQLPDKLFYQGRTDRF